MKLRVSLDLTQVRKTKIKLSPHNPENIRDREAKETTAAGGQRTGRSSVLTFFLKETSMKKNLITLDGLAFLLALLTAGSAHAQFAAGAAGYNPYTGGGGRAGVGYNPYTGNVAGGRTAYNPYTGGSAQRRTVYNPYTGGGATVRRGYNPYTGRAGVSVRRW